MTKLKTRLGQMAVATTLATRLPAVAPADSADAEFAGQDRTEGAKILTVTPDGPEQLVSRRNR